MPITSLRKRQDNHRGSCCIPVGKLCSSNIIDFIDFYATVRNSRSSDRVYVVPSQPLGTGSQKLPEGYLHQSLLCISVLCLFSTALVESFLLSFSYLKFLARLVSTISSNDPLSHLATCKHRAYLFLVGPWSPTLESWHYRLLRSAHIWLRHRSSKDCFEFIIRNSWNCIRYAIESNIILLHCAPFFNNSRTIRSWHLLLFHKLWNFFGPSYSCTR